MATVSKKQELVNEVLRGTSQICVTGPLAAAVKSLELTGNPENVKETQLEAFQLMMFGRDEKLTHKLALELGGPILAGPWFLLFKEGRQALVNHYMNKLKGDIAKPWIYEETDDDDEDDDDEDNYDEDEDEDENENNGSDSGACKKSKTTAGGLKDLFDSSAQKKAWINYFIQYRAVTIGDDFIVLEKFEDKTENDSAE